MNGIIISHENFLSKKLKNQHIIKGSKDNLITIIELLRFLNRTVIHHAKFENDRTILT